MATQRKTKSYAHVERVATNTPADYSNNMFKDGNNRTRNNPDVRGARGYDEAAHQGEVDFDISSEAAEVINMLPAGAYIDVSLLNPDEEGGPVGGTEEELDAMEVEGKPVDRTDRMKY